MREITDQQARHAIDTGELPAGVISSATRVAAILTQDWCSQWAAMESYLNRATAEIANPDEVVDVYVLIYNRVSYFGEFLTFKENTWGNSLIPYVRYYRDGLLVGESNYVSKGDFLSRFDVG